MEEDQSEKLHMSPTTRLSHDDWIETHGIASDYIEWFFSTSPSQIINVWVLDSSSYSQFVLTGIASGYHLKTSNTGGGKFDVSSFLRQTWYVIFWNDVFDSKSTTVSYNGYFNDNTLTPNINVTEPTSSSNYIKGEEIIVKWTSANAGNSLKVELFKGNSFNSTLLAYTLNDEVHLVQIPSSLLDGSNYRIKITSHKNAVFGFSENFTIQSYKYCKVISPAEGEVYKSGDVISIIWETNCKSIEAEIELKTFDDRDYIYYIDMNALNNGNYNWTITAQDLPETEKWFFIKVRPKDCNANVTFGGFFTIKKPSTIPSYNISIVIWAVIWINTTVIIFIKKKHHL